MYLDYFHWHYVAAPRWMLILVWRLQEALVQLFSVPFMVRTLVAHWRKDSVSLQAGSVSGIALAICWNLISRALGLTIRVSVLLVWLCSAIFLTVISAGFLLIFLAWPLLIIVGIATGIALLTNG